MNRISSVTEETTLKGNTFRWKSSTINFDRLATAYRSSIFAAHRVDTAVGNPHIATLRKIDPISMGLEVNVVDEQSITTLNKNSRITTIIDIQIADFQYFRSRSGQYTYYPSH